MAGVLACWVPQGALTRCSGQKMVFPYYHTVSDETLSHIRNVFPYRSVSRFSGDLDYLQRHFRPAGLKEMIRWQEDASSLRQPHFFLSFDDGLREVYEVIAPMLVKKGIPAVFFLNTGFLDNRALFYRYKASLILDRLETIRYSPATAEIMQSRFHLPGRDKRHIVRFIRDVNYDRRTVLDEMAAILELDFDAFLKVKKPYMTSEQVRELAGQGFCIGAHSTDHPDFSLLGMETRLEQFHTSLDFVMKGFGQTSGLFAFPFSDSGVSNAFFNRVQETRKAAATFGTGGLKNDPIPFHHQRISMEALRLPAGLTLRGEFMVYLVQSLLGRNTVRR